MEMNFAREEALLNQRTALQEQRMSLESSAALHRQKIAQAKNTGATT
jgi:hypothetical protein